MNQGTSEGSETSEQEYVDTYLTRQIQIYRVYFCSGIIWKFILKKGQKSISQKYTAYLDFLCRELSKGGLGIAVCSLYGFSGTNFVCVSTGGPI